MTSLKTNAHYLLKISSTDALDGKESNVLKYPVVFTGKLASKFLETFIMNKYASAFKGAILIRGLSQ